MQVGISRGQIDVGQGQTACRLLDVNALADAGLGALLQLLKRRLVLNVIFLGKKHQLPRTNDIEIGATRLKRDVFRGIEQFKVTDQFGLAQALDLAGRGKTVEDHLVQRQCTAMAGKTIVAAITLQFQ